MDGQIRLPPVNSDRYTAVPAVQRELRPDSPSPLAFGQKDCIRQSALALRASPVEGVICFPLASALGREVWRASLPRPEASPKERHACLRDGVSDSEALCVNVPWAYAISSYAPYRAFRCCFGQVSHYAASMLR